MSPQALAYNLKRAIKVRGARPLMKAMKAQGDSPVCFVNTLDIVSR